MRKVIMLALVCATMFGQSSAPTQTEARKPIVIPNEFTNLQVLPKNISKPQLMAVMKGLAVNMKVRCSYCHTVNDDLTEGRFDSDDKETKVSTRKLLKTVAEVFQTAPTK